MKFFPHIAYIILLCLLPGTGRSNNASYYFKQIAIEQGLSQSSINSILCDHKGILWIGTKSGLNCYDQHELKSFFNEKDNKYSLPGNYIQFVAEDSLNNLWVSTNKGLVKYNPDYNNFDPIIKEKIFSYLCIPGGILFGGEKTLYRFDYQNKKIERTHLNTENHLREAGEYSILSILNIEGDKVLLNTKKHGLLTYNYTTNEIYKDDSLPFTNTVSAIFINAEGYIYLSPYRQGLFCYDPKGKLIAHYKSENSKLSNNIILSILEKDGDIWIGTDGGGINIYHPSTKDFTVLQHIPGDANSLPVNSITVLYMDNEKNLWAGSVRGGIFGIKETYIRTYKDVALNNTNGLSEKAITSLYEDNDSLLWIGTDGGGINVYNPFTDTFKQFTSTYGDKVTSITGLSDTELLVSLFNQGIVVFNKKTGKYTPFTIVNNQINTEECYYGFMPLAHKVSNDKIYILSLSARIYYPETKTFSTIKTKETDFSLEALNLTYADDSLIFMIKENYVLQTLQKNDSLSLLFTTEPSETIHTLCYDKKGTVWIGSDQGLSYYNLNEKVLHRINTRLFNNVSYLFLDDKGRLWIGAQNMLFSYVIDEGRFIIWSESDGFSPNEILFMYQEQSKTNNIYLAGTDGLVKIDKNISYNNDLQPEINLSDILFNGSTYLKEFDATQRSITVPWNYTSLSVVFNINQKDIFRKTMFRYKIEGANEQYIESYNNKLNLPVLLPGSYSIIASYNTKSGIWSQPKKILTLHITPPWYKSNLFIVSAILLIIGIITATVYTILKKKENRLKWEMKEHEQAMNEEKIQFLVNISHELRTPLTLIYAPLKRLIDTSHENLNPEVIHGQLNTIYKQSRKMKNLINMVLDLNRIKTEQKSLQKQPHPLNKWIVSVSEDFKTELEEKSIQLIYQLDTQIESIWFDEWKCQTIFSNILMNALKFCEPETQITVSTQLMGNYVRVAVADQGIGLQNVDPRKLFNRFYQGKHNKSGSGIGLSYAKVLIEMHGGHIGAYNNPDKGATFYYELPISPENTTSGQQETQETENKENLSIPLDLSATGISCAGYSLLIVEDKDELRLFLKDSFKDIFKQVYTAENGLAALEITKAKQPDIIVSDVMMPQMDGYELCKNIKNDIEISHIPIILLTAKCDQESTEQGYKLGADFYIPKPFELDFLLTIILNLLKSREAIKQKYKESSTLLLPQEATISNADEHFMSKMNELIDNNLANPDLDVSYLMKKMTMSRASLYNKVKVLTGMGVNDYINKIRIEKASLMLIQTDLTISEISYEVGFTYQRYFSTIFKQVKGMTPTQFKEKNRRKES